MEIRKATSTDVEEMQQLIQQFADIGLMLPRTIKSLCEHLQCFTVAVEDGKVIGVAGLHVLWTDLAEIRSLAVAPEAHGRGVGRQMVTALLQEAEHLGIAQVLSLTYQTGFFEKLDFHIVRKESLPHKVWKDCIYCNKFYHCDEVAMVYYTSHHQVLRPAREA
ncbi:GCN5-related N-acetyltransferase [Alicyclobacillus hesperidum URH17-3-68]|uniref:Acetyltransferase n=1 Tax=Alicyclobacillus hesperidum TaxID=89784 RepID=A0A1H2XFL7_9BACL|nr:N-acetyltransferase [Alicyclobacillus hesperidum]KRW92478.1 acetyltransferase [Alicyclobacillus tengchongensis]EJY54415.1 GCN5-related N-acetyltransferase [Alicyclobacillus hesperidum URH17-3-68]SDW91581.1 N-acetylglutamate synthase [Alicyclobacillus hesperidum]GLG01184.1 acetyltransferase [Alicyclobacillus hesperidum subsp. aegles]GLV13628.1 acetyltransferase [Alicyclobacillus hesperidum]